MKGTKTSLFLVELIISLLLFSFCAAICIQIFNAASKRARDSEALNRAVFLAEQAAELYKAAGGDIARTSESYSGGVPIYSGGVMKVYYDENWSEALNPIFSAAIGDAAKYELKLSETNDGAAEVAVSERPNGELDGSKIIFSINVKAVA